MVLLVFSDLTAEFCSPLPPQVSYSFHHCCVSVQLLSLWSEDCSGHKGEMSSIHHCSPGSAREPRLRARGPTGLGVQLQQDLWGKPCHQIQVKCIESKLDHEQMQNFQCILKYK